MSTYTEDHLVEQPAIQLMQHELGWEVVLTGRLKPALQWLNPDLPVAAIEGAVEEMRILNVGFWILHGRGTREMVPGLNPLLPAFGRAKVKRDFHGIQMFYAFVKVVGTVKPVQFAPCGIPF